MLVLFVVMKEDGGDGHQKEQYASVMEVLIALCVCLFSTGFSEDFTNVVPFMAAMCCDNYGDKDLKNKLVT